MKESQKNSNFSVIAGYLLGLPALYTVLTVNKKETKAFAYADKALRMWIWFFVAFFALRLIINLIWRFFYIPYLDKLEIVLVLYFAYYAITSALRCVKE